MSTYYSIVVPLNNEEENVEELIAEISPVMHSLGKPWELICVNDGSTDNTHNRLKKLAQDHPELRILSFDKNYGQSSAFDAGFKAVRGQYVITMDGDRQNDPRDIPKLLACLDEADLVCGRRIKRKDTLVKRLTSFVANAVRRRLCKDGVQDTGCSLKVYRTECLEKIKIFHGMHRFLPALFIIEGFRVKEIDVNHQRKVSKDIQNTIFLTVLLIPSQIC